MLTKIEIIQQTAKYYSEDTSRRSINKLGNCVYKSENNNKCAFAYWCIEDIILPEENNANDLLDKLGFDILKEEARIENTTFWFDLQFFHDQTEYWDKSGLTILGNLRLDNLLMKYKD